MSVAELPDNPLVFARRLARILVPNTPMPDKDGFVLSRLAQVAGWMGISDLDIRLDHIWQEGGRREDAMALQRLLDEMVSMGAHDLAHWCTGEPGRDGARRLTPEDQIDH